MCIGGKKMSEGVIISLIGGGFSLLTAMIAMFTALSLNKTKTALTDLEKYKNYVLALRGAELEYLKLLRSHNDEASFLAYRRKVHKQVRDDLSLPNPADTPTLSMMGHGHLLPDEYN